MENLKNCCSDHDLTEDTESGSESRCSVRWCTAKIVIDVGLDPRDWLLKAPEHLLRCYEEMLAAAQALAGVGLHQSDADTEYAMRYTIALAREYLADAERALEGKE